MHLGHRRAALPATPLGRTLGFRPLPGLFFLALILMVVAYLLLIELGKYWFYRSYRTPAAPAAPTISGAFARGEASRRTLEIMRQAHAADDTDPGPGALVLTGRTAPMLDRARIYVCGITPYDVTHLGHAATFVWVDALGRVLRLLGTEPQMCRNVTDVDDALDAAASRAGAPYDEFAAIQQYYFEHDLATLNVQPPRHEPRAHRYVEHVIRLARGLIAVGAAYERDGSVYFPGR